MTDTDTYALRVRELQQDPRVCAYCFTRVRTHAEGHDEHEARALSVGPTKETFHAQGHQLDSDGTEDAAANTFDPDPDARVEYVDGGRVLFCATCGREVNAGTEAGEHRDTSALVRHFKNLCDTLGVDDVDAGKDAVVAAARNQNLAGEDVRVLARGLAAVGDNRENRRW